MCGRFTLKTPAPRLMELFQVDSFPEIRPRYNIAPTQNVVCVRYEESARSRVAAFMRWGLIPFWASDESIGNRMINARSETVAEKPAFRQAFLKRRCLIVADGFYEWQTPAKGPKQPWLIQLEDGQPFGMAGLWEVWRPKRKAADSSTKNGATLGHSTGTADDDAVIFSCSILTTTANREMQPLHDRMPVILTPDQYDTWLRPEAGREQCLSLLCPLQDGLLSSYRVSTVVNRPINESPECVVPLKDG